MSRTISREPASDDVEKFFEAIFPVIPKIVRKACISLGRDPNQMDVDEFTQRIGVLLWKNDYRVLRSFKSESLLETWLFAIAKRNILRWLREWDEMESLEDKLPDSFIIWQDQDEKLLSKERGWMLRKAVRKLTEHDKKLCGLLLQERGRKEISEEMRIEKRSVSVEKAALAKKLRRIIREDYAI